MSNGPYSAFITLKNARMCLSVVFDIRGGK
jgi:hypothetical protein